MSGTKVPAQYLKALRASGRSESAFADFHELRRGLIPDDRNARVSGFYHARSSEAGIYVYHPSLDIPAGSKCERTLVQAKGLIP